MSLARLFTFIRKILENIAGIIIFEKYMRGLCSPT